MMLDSAFVFELFQTEHREHKGFMLYTISKQNGGLILEPEDLDFCESLVKEKDPAYIAQVAKRLSFDYLLTFNPNQHYICSHKYMNDDATHFEDSTYHRNAISFFNAFEQEGIVLVEPDQEHIVELYSSLQKYADLDIIKY